MIQKKLNHGHVKLCQLKTLLLLPLLITVFLHQLNGTQIQFFLMCKGSYVKKKKHFYSSKYNVCFIFYKLDTKSRGLSSDLALKTCFFRGFKLTKNVDPGKYVYSGYGIRLNLRSEFPLPDSSVDQNGIIFGVDMNSSMHIDNKKKDILILRKGPTQGFEDITLIAEDQY